MTIKKAGYAAIVGRPNVGKSTLLNALLGEKLSITSPKPQTTRWQILGIQTVDDTQVIYVDTPGMNQTQQNAMHRYLNRVASGSFEGADVIVFVVDAKYWREEDDYILSQIKKQEKPVILAINKMDLLDDKAKALPLIEKLSKLYDFTQIIPVSAYKKDNLKALEHEIAKLMPESEAIYPEDQLTDRSIRFLAGEIIREKVIMATENELPYATVVEIDQFTSGEKLTEISAIIWVEREGQRMIVIGKKGLKLKTIGTQARKEIERLVGGKVFLRLWVKIKSGWTDSETALRGLGFD